MSKKGVITVEGVVGSIAGGGWHAVTTDEGREIRAKLGGRLRNNHIKVVAGDRVKLELSPTDLTVGRIVYRFNPTAETTLDEVVRRN